MVSVMVSILSQISLVQWKISDTFKIKKPVKSLRPEVIFAIINLIKLAALSDLIFELHLSALDNADKRIP